VLPTRRDSDRIHLLNAVKGHVFRLVESSIRSLPLRVLKLPRNFPAWREAKSRGNLRAVGASRARVNTNLIVNHSLEAFDAFILAGGASRRMGTDKAQLSLHGATMLENTAEILRSISATVTVVGRDIKHQQLNSVSDIYPQWGALGGVHAALI